MIVSHRHRFIFIKTRKTAGTSIEIALSKFCGAHDILSPISPADEKIRANLGYRGPTREYLSFSNYSLKQWFNFLRRGKRQLKYYNHMSAGEIKSLVGERIWSSYFKFSIDRDPFEKVISFYHWWVKYSDADMSLSEFVASSAVKRALNYKLYTIDGALAVDYLMRYEKLEEELEIVSEKLKLPEKLVLPKAKSDVRKDKRSAREVLSADQAKRIAEVFSTEIALQSQALKS